MSLHESTTTRTIHVAAALVVDERGRTLVVRKRGTTRFQQPGGKLDPGETSLAALIRELDEEIGLRVTTDALVPLGRFSASAANEAGHTVVADVYRLDITHRPIVPGAELEEVRWIDPAAPGDLPLAPLTRDHLLPLAIEVRRSNPH